MGVGTIVFLSAIAFVYQLPSTFFPFSGELWYADWAALGVLYLAYAAISLPFDVWGGYWLPCRHHRLCLLFPVFIMKWLRGIAVQGLVMTLSALALLQAGRRWGVWGALAVVALIQLLLLALQLPLALWAGGLRHASSPEPKVSALHGLDPGFTGGTAGLPGLEQHVFPQSWWSELSAASLLTEMKRRQGSLATGSRFRGVLLALAWNLTGFWLCASLPWAGVTTVYTLVETLLGCTLWSFLGLLILPSFSRPGVLEADRYALTHGASPQQIESAMREIDHLQDDEPRRSRWVERIFHPIPTVDNRLAALSSGSSSYGAWHAARLALYLSWAQFGLLSRAVHCNSGRPELWVMLPCD
jgi:Zn-dependent protease with chaperone function